MIPRVSVLRCAARNATALSAAPQPQPQRRWKSIVQIQEFEPNEREPKTFIRLDMMKDKPGSLQTALDCFKRHDVNLTHIESRLKTFAREGPSFLVDFEGQVGDAKVDNLLQTLREECAGIKVMPPREVPWFPANIRDLDKTKDALDGETDLIAPDHPGFHDEEYRKRRNMLTEIAQTYKHGSPIPRIEYTAQETEVWSQVYDRVQALSQEHACKEYLEIMPRMEKYCGYARDNIPQLQDISDYLQMSTGFTLRPVQGLLSARDFLNALAFRVFFSTQYIRHHGNPFYTPEPDICHELLGHAPMFADPDFADFSHMIGLASLAASDECIDKLATCYWFTVEFGLCKQDGVTKAYGAGLLSSFGELEWSCGDAPSQECRESGGIIKSFPALKKPELRPFVPQSVAEQTFPITTYQPIYFLAESLQDAKKKMGDFCDTEVSRPFHPQYDPLTQSIRVTKSVWRSPKTSTAQLQVQKQKDYFDNLEKDSAEKVAAAAE